MTEHRNLQVLPSFSDSLSYLYIQHAVVERDAGSVCAISETGTVEIPVASLTTLILGPGTTITHAAVKTLVDCGCSILWAGEDSLRCYAQGHGETRSSARLMEQARIWANPALHEKVVLRMYRFRFAEELPEGLSLAQVRGMEGVRVREAYLAESRRTAVQWTGRNYVRGAWSSADPINRAISTGAACLNGICHAAIVSSGYSPGLGFIHTGKMLSFVYDIADLYRLDIVVPAAFQAVAEGAENVEPRVRAALRIRVSDAHLLERVIADIGKLFAGLGESGRIKWADLPIDTEPDPAIWNGKNTVSGGVQYGGDGS